MYKHYTIHCAPKKFDNKFRTFIELNKDVTIKSIHHENDYHYILYKVSDCNCDDYLDDEDLF